MELFDAIKTRRSVRRYTDAPVSDQQAEAILEAGRWAPSWHNTQCWRFIVVRDPDVKLRMTEALLPFIQTTDTPAPNPSIEVFKIVPVVIVVCAELGASGATPAKGGVTRGDFFTEKGDWFMFDTALAVQNMVLAAHGLGLGTVIIGTFDAPKLEKILGVPAGFRVVTMFPVGVPARTGNPPPRKEMAEIIHRDGWGK